MMNQPSGSLGNDSTKGYREDLSRGIPEDVHTRHCCPKHGCKYGKDDECTVVIHRMSGWACEECGLERSGYYGPLDDEGNVIDEEDEMPGDREGYRSRHRDADLDSLDSELAAWEAASDELPLDGGNNGDNPGFVEDPNPYPQRSVGTIHFSVEAMTKLLHLPAGVEIVHVGQNENDVIMVKIIDPHHVLPQNAVLVNNEWQPGPPNKGQMLGSI